MKTSTLQVRQLGPTISKIMVSLVFASMMGAIATGPALARDDNRSNEHQDQGRRDEHQDQDRRRDESQFDRDRRGDRQPNYYAQPVYAPPPVYYAPQPSPGISLFFPLDIRIR
jgi:Ni/Co efflux regulator RcnB